MSVNTDNQPVEGYSFRIKALVRDNSGGHDHSDGRPTGKFVTALKETLAIVQGKTDSAGKAEYTYVCSGIGGIDSFFVQGATEKDTASAAIMIKIGDWNELPAGTKYKLVGETSAHGRNHFGTANTIKRLKALADSAYADSTWTFQYNNISLINGGPFDVSPDHRWDTPHQLHREGVNVDMRTVSLDGKNISLRWLEEILKKHNWGRIEEEDKGNANHHFHLTLYKRSESREYFSPVSLR